MRSHDDQRCRPQPPGLSASVSFANCSRVAYQDREPNRCRLPAEYHSTPRPLGHAPTSHGRLRSRFRDTTAAAGRTSHAKFEHHICANDHSTFRCTARSESDRVLPDRTVDFARDSVTQQLPRGEQVTPSANTVYARTITVHFVVRLVRNQIECFPIAR